MGGFGPPTLANTELWNGTNWTEVNDLGTARYQIGFAGTSTSAIGVGSNATPYALVESWNGTNWTEVADLNTGRESAGTVGTSAAAITFGGGNAPVGPTATELWNGASWAETSNLNTGRNYIAGAGDQTNALGFGGDSGSRTGATEEWSSTSTTTKTVSTD